MQRIGLLIFILFGMTSCYRMPTDEDVSVVPVTNNPNITHTSDFLVPGMPNH